MTPSLFSVKITGIFVILGSNSNGRKQVSLTFGFLKTSGFLGTAHFSSSIGIIIYVAAIRNSVGLFFAFVALKSQTFKTNIDYIFRINQENN